MITPSSETTIPVREVVFRSAYEAGLPLWLVVDTYIDAASVEEANAKYANVAPDMVVSLAVASNAAVLDGEVLSIYETTLTTEPHAFVQQYPSAEERYGNPSHRRPRTDFVCEVLACGGTLDERLQRALGLYALALKDCHPHRHVISALRLYTAIENLGEYLIRQLSTHHHGGDREALARSYGLPGRDVKLENQLRGYVRGKLILENQQMSRDLKEARNGFEHGYLNFREVSRLVEPHYFQAMAHVHVRLLKELPISDQCRDYFADEGFDKPLGAWQPVVQVGGHFSTQNPSHFAVDSPLLLVNASLRDVHYELESQEDHKHTGQLTYTVHMQPQMPDSVVATPNMNRYIVPGQGEQLEPTLTSMKLNDVEVDPLNRTRDIPARTLSDPASTQEPLGLLFRSVAWLRRRLGLG